MTSTLASAINFKRLILSVPTMLWILMWLSINTPYDIFDKEPHDIIEWLHFVRAGFPYLVMVVGIVYLALKRSRYVWYGPAGMWFIYGLIAFPAALMSPEPYEALYWAVAYLAAFLAMRAFVSQDDSVEAAERLNRLNWIVTTLFLLMLVFFAKDYLLPIIIDQRSGYNIYTQIQTVMSMPMSRSSGMARFAAVPALIAFVMLWHSNGLKRFLWISLFIPSIYLIYLMQSRGAIFAMAFAISFILLFQGRKSRIAGIILISLFSLLLLTDIIPVDVINDIKDYIYRGQSYEDLRSLTGRTRSWDAGLETALESPFIGWGFQSDRLLIRDHVHNAYLYAFMTAGLPGLAAFTGGLVWAWILFIRIVTKYKIHDASRRIFLIQVGGILAFFTVRSIPEVCGSLFAVDYMIMLPILAYLNLLYRRLRETNIPRSDQMALGENVRM